MTEVRGQKSEVRGQKTEDRLFGFLTSDICFLSSESEV